ncbi:MAG: hypothetical protein OXG98_13620 [Gemmatimonadetes bacterium]|nr:hypothetical protein [Gemmatimonadota bacterium]
MQVLKYAAVLMTAILATGCTYSIRMNPDIGPTASIARPVDLRVGLYIPREFKGFVMVDRPDLEKYICEIGASLESVITKSANRVFSQVSILDAQPADDVIGERQLDLVVIPRVNSAMVSLNREEGPFQDDARGNTAVSVELMFYDAEMRQFTSVMASGVGFASERIGFFSRGQREYAASVEGALKNLSDDMVRQMYGNYDIRKKAEESE